MSAIQEITNRKRVTVFTGNRAEFGIIYPLLIELAKGYFVDLVLSGAHTQSPWNTKQEVYALLAKNNLPINTYEIAVPADTDHYKDSMVQNYTWGYDYFKKNKKSIPVELCIVLGDRVESYAFANGAFFNKVPVCHIFGGDVSNVPYFDTNIRHAITKISSLHLVSNKASLNNVLRMGEESWRCELIGNISLDNYQNGNYAKKDELIEQYGLKDELTIVLTYHPSQYVSESINFKNFKSIFDDCKSLGVQTVITYPNNDEGHKEITDFLETQPNRSGSIFIEKNLGIKNYLGILKEFNCIMIGNSSSGLYETAYTGTPSVNIGDRQVDRPRSINVIDLELEKLNQLKSVLEEIVSNYNEIKVKNLTDYDFFGKGESVKTSLDKIRKFLQIDIEERFFKKLFT